MVGAGGDSKTTQHNPGTDSPAGCGANSSYEVAYEIKRTADRGFSPLPGQAVFDHGTLEIAAVSRRPGLLDLFVIGNDDRVWTEFADDKPAAGTDVP